MTASAIVMGVVGIIASFLPQEILTYAGLPSAGIAPLFIQVLGALYLGFAMINWMVRAQLIGGIYGRPVAMGNFLHFMVGALALLKGYFSAPVSGVLLGATGIYTIFAISFTIVLFTHPLKRDAAK